MDENINKIQSLLNKHNYLMTANEILERIYGKNYKDNILYSNIYKNVKLNKSKIGTFITEHDFKTTSNGHKYLMLNNEYNYSSYGYLYNEDEDNDKDYVLCNCCNYLFEVQYWCFGGSKCKCGMIDLND